MIELEEAFGGRRRRTAILTSGGDCPGLNAVIRGVALGLTNVHDRRLIGLRGGWRGVIDDSETVELTPERVSKIGGQGGTILGSSRTNPFGAADVANVVMRRLESIGADSLVVVGGDGSLTVAQKLVDLGLPIVGVPKTIDNDISGTDICFGFDTAVQIATDAIDRLQTTGDAHFRCMVVEVMGRHAGWIALHAGTATGATAILIPEMPVDFGQVIAWVKSAMANGRAPLIVVAEGYVLSDAELSHADRGDDAFGRPRLGGIGEMIARRIENEVGIESRATILGHIQRGGTPSSFDRVLSTRFGFAAADAVAAEAWGTMIALKGTDLVRVPIDTALRTSNQVPAGRYRELVQHFG